ncbi:uncharacterized protein A4U43_C05F19530 [Asparagus officinalis]|uniref:Uncharacterized protein n=1 Tax=Asparagus officinalis TaxID=4686 RepID=A0A5P1EVC7_ASPOF|nr:uncharacterized protein A4U43_C05F19530 [Asparagus officinalis]
MVGDQRGPDQGPFRSRSCDAWREFTPIRGHGAERIYSTTPSFVLPAYLLFIFLRQTFDSAAVLYVDKQLMEGSHLGSHPVPRKRLRSNLEAAEGFKKRKKAASSQVESSTRELSSLEDEAVEATLGEIEATPGSISGVKTPESSRTPLEYIEVEGDSPHTVPKEEVREGDIFVMEPIGSKYPFVVVAKEVSIGREEVLTILGERIGSSRRPSKALAIKDPVVEAYKRIALGSRILPVAIHEDKELKVAVTEAQRSEAQLKRAYEVQQLGTLIAHLESKAFETAIIERYCGSYLGKVKVALACKVGFDYLKGQLSLELLLKDRFKYPSRMTNCLDVLRTLGVQGRLEMAQEDEEVADEGVRRRLLAKMHGRT